MLVSPYGEFVALGGLRQNRPKFIGGSGDSLGVVHEGESVLQNISAFWNQFEIAPIDRGDDDVFHVTIEVLS